MTSAKYIRVFVSYTAEDLKVYADEVAVEIRKLDWQAVDHRDWSATGRPSVEECKRRIESCQVLVVLVAHRYGWVPAKEDGGDGVRSIVEIEVDYALEIGLRVLPFVMSASYPWAPQLMEALANPSAGERLDAFKVSLGRRIRSEFLSVDHLARHVHHALYDVKTEIEEEEGRATGRPSEEQPGSPPGRTRGEQSPKFVYPWLFEGDRSPTLRHRLTADLPKRVLVLGGGGANLAAVFGTLSRIEQLGQTRYGWPQFRLGHYFDLIVGSGLGAVIAAELARPSDVASAYGEYEACLAAAYHRRWNSWRSVYRTRSLQDLLSKRYAKQTPHSLGLGTGLAILLTNWTDRCATEITNHPDDPKGSKTTVADALFAAASMPVFHDLAQLAYEPVRVGVASTAMISMGTGCCPNRLACPLRRERRRSRRTTPQQRTIV